MNCHPSSTYEVTRGTRRDADVVAIVSAACRYPGGCDSPDAFWEMMKRGRTGFRAAPPGRWPGWNRVGGFLEPPFPQAFDAAFFDIAPAEAIALDPQQRLLLEVGWRALEGAGIALDPGAGRTSREAPGKRGGPVAVGPHAGGTRKGISRSGRLAGGGPARPSRRRLHAGHSRTGVRLSGRRPRLSRVPCEGMRRRPGRGASRTSWLRGRLPKPSICARIMLTKPPCSTATPLGRPVEPEV